MEKMLKVALVGYGKMGKHHIKAIEIQPNSELVAIADPLFADDSASHQISGSISLFSDVEEMFDKAKPDVVHIVTPPETHTDLSRLAIKHGCHIYVEKPFALTLEEAEKTLELADENNIKVCAAHQVLFQDSGQRYRKDLELLGNTIQIESYFSFKTVRQYTPVEQLIDILPHPVYLLLDAFEKSNNKLEDDDALELVNIYTDPRGEIFALVQQNNITGHLNVSLRARPIESYLHLRCSNGSTHADFVLSGIQKLPGPGVSAISQVFIPFSRARQLMWGTLSTIVKTIFKKHKSYAGLGELVAAFHNSIHDNTQPPIDYKTILNTVSICENVVKQLKEHESTYLTNEEQKLSDIEASLSETDSQLGTILVTGGTGFLGKVFCQSMRDDNWGVRVITRKLPLPFDRVPGVEYVIGDISDDLPDHYFKDISIVVHLAAETAGGKEEHEKNTIEATRKLITTANKHNVKHFVNISSIAVLKPSREVGGPLNEDSPVDRDNLSRGPYVWGKAKAEDIVVDISKTEDISSKTIRLGPLVDYRNFSAPGRLGREVGPFYVAMGNPWEKLFLCDVNTASDVIKYYCKEFDDCPDTINLVEPEPKKRSELVKMLKSRRKELSVIWMPSLLLRLISVSLKFTLKLLRPSKKPLDLYAAFSSEVYDTTLANNVVNKSRIRRPSK
ncbi:MAG: Gfo/Idh/MocA family oxidoreductase [Candidatus Thiodiazotropha sp. (ex Ctena orbiculata)]|uniref:Gfo/Idh/MocA family oxidoreductase n=1 Tax=Candidatus Thiodiazotropha taylori TaxID=2792791 RepID=A0A944M7H4_9GAMM|nr:Gfo/Idh/MocA family oxidoreductase [Candidatus Thiodiazotropha taylori]MBT2988525.1 Gfo/Idh/MocA family oxidoreductase [Candidatus Thiodiazotropha taylori]MBT3001187.1 Gfo/Idh/MocA family oxidoreductase [Candidatus Thiodiazotropha taylori]MBT3027677.1 Gfo/Idh/MocA family oxidoreductase [Candidatus Thiodiazotropha taylori]MBT3035289.1 Gfo/Idh/MocA family oxidoreductase [Candidatus Thiodiazotropha taylori]